MPTVIGASTGGSVIKSIQRGSNTAETVTITAVDLTKSIVVLSVTTQTVGMRGNLASSTSLVLTGEGIADWQVIEFN